jgi:hypothetical protein
MILVTHKKYPNKVFRIYGYYSKRLNCLNNPYSKFNSYNEKDYFYLAGILTTKNHPKSTMYSAFTIINIGNFRDELTNVKLADISLYKPIKLSNRRFPLQKDLKFIPKIKKE